MLNSIISRIALSSPGRKTLLTPGFVNPGLLKRSLALQSGQLANLDVQPLSAFLVNLALPHCSGKVYLSGEKQFWFMMGLLNSLRPRLKYFHDSVQFHGICSLVIETLNDLHLNGVNPKNAGGLAKTKKWNDIALIHNAYEARKSQEHVFDYADAVTSLHTRHTPLPDTYLIKHHLTLLEKELVHQCAIEEIDPAAEIGDTSYELSAYKVDTSYQEALQTIRNVAADLQSGTAPHRIGVCVWDYSAAWHHMRPVLETMDVPDLIHFVKGEPLFATAPGNLWKYFTEWVMSDFSIRGLLSILESPAFDRGDVESAVFHRAVRCFRKADLPLFNAGFPGAFNGFLDGLVARDTDDEEEESAGERIVADLARELASRFEPVVTGGAVQDQLHALGAAFESSVRIRNETDAAAAGRVLAALDDAAGAAGADGFATSLVDVLGVLNNKLSLQHVNATVPDGTRPVLGTVNELLYLDLDILYILGLNEKGPPGMIYENPVLLDQEKMELKHSHPGAMFRLREDRLHEHETAFALLRGTVKTQLILSAPLKDLTTGREMLVSRYLLNEWNRWHNRRDDYKAISSELALDRRSLNNHIPQDLEGTFYPYELAVAAHVQHMDREASHGALEKEFPFAAMGQEFRRARHHAGRFDAYWGVVRAEDKRPLPVVSASRLGCWARCPYQYFLKHELRLDRDIAFDVGELEWLDALAYGSFLHELFYRFFVRLRNMRGDGFSVVQKTDESLLWEEFGTILPEYTMRYPVVSVVHYEATVSRLKQDAAGFLKREVENPSTRLYAELSFGMSAVDDDENTLGREEPGEILLTDRKRLLVRGRIDRVDRTTEGRHVLIDYKSGKSRDVDPDTPFGGGEMMQAGLYSEIASQIDKRLQHPLFRFYYATERGGYGEHVVDYPSHRKHFLGFLTTLVSEIRRGNFVPAATDPEKFPCSFCDYADVCVKGRGLLIERLQESPELVRYKEIVETEAES